VNQLIQSSANMTKRPSLSEINGMKRDELRDLVKELMKESSAASPSLAANGSRIDSIEIMTLLHGITGELNALKTANATLLSEIGDLKAQLQALQSNQTPRGVPDTLPNTPSFAEIVRSTMTETINAEKCKTQVVISIVDEGSNDHDYVRSLCDKVEQSSKPQSVWRMGKKEAGQARPLRVTFESSFEARSFMSRYSSAKNKEGVPAVKVRSCRTKEEEAMYKEKLRRLRELNAKAKADGDTLSFSLRDNVSIWRFKKNATSGKWSHDLEWSEEVRSRSTNEPSGNAM
jgi:hypothetical protein